MTVVVSDYAIASPSYGLVTDMQRVTEPELMNDPLHAQAYARADFEAAHSRIVEQFGVYFPGVELAGNILDLGCGPGEFFGTRQSGMPELRIADIVEDKELLLLARNLAFEVVARDPQLRDQEQAGLRRYYASHLQGKFKAGSIG